ncbi:MAG: NAD(P)H-binding protein [Leptospira sp.]|nr:NAD(P)H-binding protein [Leptospira sp.]
MSLKTLAVIGASKGIGLATVSVAMERGWKVRTLSRSQLPLPPHENLTTFTGSVLDKEKVKEVVQGASAVVVSLGHPISLCKVNLYSEGTKNIIDTLLGWNPKAYLMVVTGIGAGESAGHGGFFYDKFVKPVILRKDYQDKNRQEILVRLSKLDWVIVRPGFLNDGELTGVYRCMEDLEGITAGKISRLDCADFLIREAEAKVWKGKTPLIG